ncbi:hypothetical protein FLA_0487 [Filimonas lacunae]|nr:hypothetical protein FLA_0487 [Filimonas lacunae]
MKYLQSQTVLLLKQQLQANNRIQIIVSIKVTILKQKPC